MTPATPKRTTRIGSRAALKWLALVLGFTLGVASVPSSADANVAVGAANFTGSRSTPSGLVGLGRWSQAMGGIKVHWLITFDGSVWTYKYEFKDKNGTPLSPDISHTHFEVSVIINTGNVGDFIWDAGTIAGPMAWMGDPNSPNEENCGSNGGNPNLPGPIYGMKLDYDGPSYTFKSTQPPMWGDLYVKSGDGDGGPCTSAWNKGFGTDPDNTTVDFTNWIPVPDTLAICGDNAVNRAGEVCDGTDDLECPGECDDQCRCPDTPICGDDVVNQDSEQCDGTDDSACPGQCDDKCQCPDPPICGDDVVNQDSEQCDGSDDSACPGQCDNECKCPPDPTCGDGMINQEGELCDGNDDGACPGLCTDQCLCPICGDDDVNQPGEQCDGSDDTLCPGECSVICKCPVCGDGVVSAPSEECEPPNSEDCNNQVDDDNDGLIDCLDPDCLDPTNPSMGIVTCDENCLTDMPCTPVRKDPATIRWGKDGNPDRLKIHGRFERLSPMAPLVEGFGVLLSNEFGVIYQASLISGDMKGKVGGRRFTYRDKQAKLDGEGRRSGIFRIGVRERTRDGIPWLTFRVHVYGDLSLATVPEMTTQLAVGNDSAMLSAAWTQTSRGWKLHQRDF